MLAIALLGLRASVASPPISAACQAKLNAFCNASRPTTPGLLTCNLISRADSRVDAAMDAASSDSRLWLLQDDTLNGPHCIDPTTKWYPNASPFVGIMGGACEGLKCDAKHNCTCPSVAPGSSELRCYSHLALVNGSWSQNAQHP